VTDLISIFPVGKSGLRHSVQERNRSCGNELSGSLHPGGNCIAKPLENSNMMLFKRIPAFLMATLLVFVVGCASTSQQESTGEYIDDSTLTTKVKAAIFNEPTLKSAEINVETFKGVVQLSGFVSSQTAVDKAVEITRQVKGIKSVKNDMRVK
jgi:hypothetical protein